MEITVHWSILWSYLKHELLENTDFTQFFQVVRRISIGYLMIAEVNTTTAKNVKPQTLVGCFTQSFIYN